MTLYENAITRDSNLNKTDKIQEAYEKMLNEALKPKDKKEIENLKEDNKN